MNNLGTKLLQTDRLILRPLQLTDADAMYTGWTTDMDVVRHLSWKPHISIDETKRIISYWMSNYPDPKFYLWGIQLKSGRLIGTISIHSMNEGFLRGEIGYALAKSFWNQGYVTEAAKKIIDFAFGEVGFNRIEAHHALANRASGAVLIKCGMQKEGIMKEYYRSNEGFQDAQLYAITAKDWRLRQGL
jgi:ribosomal-protein-alanine N-acetyltransferase